MTTTCNIIPEATCPLCGATVEIRKGFTGVLYFFEHPVSACSESGTTTRVEESDRERAAVKCLEVSA